MEEEIIVPEEDTFGYDKLRYILNNDGYVCHVSLGGLIVCNLGECTEYTGEIPDGYETIEEWHDGEIERLNAWKIVEGNLVFDESKYAELKTKCKQEEIDNSPVYHKELYGLQQQIEDIQDVSDSQYVKETATGKVVLIDSVKKSFPRIKLTNVDPYKFNKVDLLVTGKNMLPNEATTQTISGIEFKQNADRSITINGKITENVEYNIAGTSTNTSPILVLKKGLNYYLSSNNYQIKMYNYDGTDRTEVYSGKGGIINFTDEDKRVTQIVLIVEKRNENIVVGDDLSGKKLVFNFPERFFIDYYMSNIVVTNNSRYINSSFSNEIYKVYTTTSGDPEIIYEMYNSSMDEGGYPRVRRTSLELPNDYGVVTSIDETNPAYQYIKLENDLVENETVYLQLEYGTIPSEYETYKSNYSQIDFSEYIEENPLYPSALNIKHSVLKTGTTKSGVSKALNEVLETTEALYPSDDLFPSGTSIDYIFIESGKVKAIINNEEINLGTSNTSLFNGINTINTIQDTDVEIEYCINVLDVTNLDFMRGKATSSNKFRVLEDGSIEAHNGYFSGNLELNDNGEPSSSALIVTTELDPDVETSDNGVTTVLGNRFEIKGEGIFEGDEQYIAGYLHSGIASFSVTGDVWANSFENMSLLEKKKNITPFENGLELIKNADLYNFNYKNESDEHKKHIGLIINEDYNTPNEVISDGEKSIDIYSMISVAWQSIKELNNKVEELETKIKEMEEKQYEENII